jgi:hypothetical protein
MDRYVLLSHCVTPERPTGGHRHVLLQIRLAASTEAFGHPDGPLGKAGIIPLQELQFRRRGQNRTQGGSVSQARTGRTLVRTRPRARERSHLEVTRPALNNNVTSCDVWREHSFDALTPLGVTVPASFSGRPRASCGPAARLLDSEIFRRLTFVCRSQPPRLSRPSSYRIRVVAVRVRPYFHFRSAADTPYLKLAPLR